MWDITNPGVSPNRGEITAQGAINLPPLQQIAKFGSHVEELMMALRRQGVAASAVVSISATAISGMQMISGPRCRPARTEDNTTGIASNDLCRCTDNPRTPVPMATHTLPLPLARAACEKQSGRLEYLHGIQVIAPTGFSPKISVITAADDNAASASTD